MAIVNALYASDGSLLTSEFGGGTWADDSRHLCEVLGPRGLEGGAHMTMTSANDFVGVYSPAWLYVSVPGQTRRPVTQVGEFGDHGNIEAASCSLASDRAVITSSFVATITSVSVYTLSTGERLFTSTPPRDVFAVAATHDGHLLAELDASCGGSVIYDLSRRGQPVERVQGGYVRAFSWDATAVVTTGALGNPSYVPTSAAVVDLGTSQTMAWSASLPPSGLDVDPSGATFLLAVPPVSAGYQPLSESVFLVDAHGETTPVADHTDAATGSGIPTEAVGGISPTHAC